MTAMIAKTDAMWRQITSCSVPRIAAAVKRT